MPSTGARRNGPEQGLSISDLVFSGGPRDILKFFLGSGPVLDIGLNIAKLRFEIKLNLESQLEL